VLDTDALQSEDPAKDWPRKPADDEIEEARARWAGTRIGHSE
jgi:hypothetical protein